MSYLVLPNVPLYWHSNPIIITHSLQQPIISVIHKLFNVSCAADFISVASHFGFAFTRARFFFLKELSFITVHILSTQLIILNSIMKLKMNCYCYSFTGHSVDVFKSSDLRTYRG